MSPAYFMDLCRLCLVKDKVSIPIFEGEGEVRNIFMKIVTCLPVKVDKDDKLPKKICDVCLYNVENVFKFWHTTASSEKKLLQWLEESDKNTVCNPPLQTEEVILKEEYLDEQGLENEGIEGSDNSPDDVEQSDDSNSDDEVNSEEDIVEDSVKTAQKEEAESDEDGFEELEPTTFVNVSLACEEQEQAGPSGLQVSSENTENQISAIESSIGLQPQVSQVVLQPIQSLEMQPIHSAQQVQEDAVPSTSNEASGSSGYSSFDSTVRNPTEQKILKKTFKLSIVPKQVRLITGKRWETQENDPESIECLICHSSFDSYQLLEEHIKIHKYSSQVYKCEVCNKEYRRKSLYRDHLTTHSTECPFECNLCSKKFRNKTFLRDHIKRIHAVGKRYECDICGYSTYNKWGLGLHRKRHLKQYTHICGICNTGIYGNYQFKEHMKIHSGGFQCDICFKAFQSSQYLVRHKKTHDPNYKTNNNNLCDLCGKGFVSQIYLRRHQNTHKGGNKKICDICGKTVSDLVTHRRIHTGEKPFECSFCSKMFSAKAYLTAHTRVHTGEKPFSCDTCGKTFTQQSPLIIHKRTHTGERPYKCDFCNKEFVSRSLMNTHRKKCLN